MRSRRLTVLLALAVAGTVAAPAQAAPQRTPFLPMALITYVRSADAASPDVNVFFPSEWSCWTNYQQPGVIDTTCVPPAAPPGTTNWCGWVASFSQSDQGNDFAPQTTSYCDNAAATSGRGTVAAVATANTQLTALRCRVNVSVIPPNVGFRAGCTTNH